MKYPYLLSLVLALVSCKKPVKISTTAYIIGTNDITTFEPMAESLPFEGLSHSSALITVPMDNGQLKFCSGSLIEGETPQSAPRVITNHHCFTQDIEEKTQASTGLVENHCKGAKVFLGFLKADIENKEVRRCRLGSFRSDSILDLATFELDQTPDQRFSPLTLADPSQLESREGAVIIHYPKIDESDPELKSKVHMDLDTQIPLPFAQITSRDCHTLGPFPPEEWALDLSLGFGIKHSCDQLKGSSGSALINRTTGHLLGVNWGGIKIGYGGDRGEMVVNVATASPYVAMFLEGDVDEVKKEVDAIAQNPPKPSSDPSRCGSISASAPMPGFWLLALSPCLILALRKDTLS
ncbi:trypsin-like peptidase domain-containing protein [Pseudobacteriovorax antillogorgiicola]|uniref:Trypsin-like peptidase domain-containing protein n=1 Tax=Pseudobacteriovorax antillogorgiicola TaxID=1513793 RepID=A0A1Y6BWG5_9BACT|nr:trypsin-like peptidase domain-containing protein [Pseudobacteriovorax antillogorgiicola]TCS50202.1 trypsin-like peptidase [Pseudobacteriovorax antillogorgiicola]SMF32269.1 Trypsin-like peptidase domain-containing protein [Pseudobacteriovorax antillogorgiicola]